MNLHEHWSWEEGSEELDPFREVLRRYRWVMGSSLEEGGGIETWFPPDDLPLPGISLSPKHHGFWSTLGYNSNEIVQSSPELLERYLSERQPYVA